MASKGFRVTKIAPPTKTRKCPAHEGAVGIDCILHKGHSGSHIGYHLPDNPTESDYSFTIRWPMSNDDLRAIRALEVK